MKIMIQALLIALTLLGCSKPEMPSPADTSPIAPQEEAFAGQMLAQVNALRETGCRCGSQWMPAAPPLRWNSLLARAAQRHANDMHRNNFFNHRGSDGSDMARRVRDAGYDWRTVAENIAWGHPDVASVVQ